MSFVSYVRQELSVNVDQTFHSQIKMIIPVTADTVLLIKKDSTYQYLGIHQNQLLIEGKLPLNFPVHSYIQPKFPLNNVVVCLHDFNGNICRLNLQQNTHELRTLIGKPLQSTNNVTMIRYQLMDSQSQNFVVSTIDSNNFNTFLCCYKWQHNKYSNIITFDRNYSNYKIMFLRKHDISQLISFVVFSTGEKYSKIYCIQMELDIQEYTISVKNRKQLKIGFSYYPLDGVYSPPCLYMIGNNGNRSITLLQYNIDENVEHCTELLMRGQEKKSGIAKNVFALDGKSCLIEFQPMRSPSSSVQLYSLLLNDVTKNFKLHNQIELDEITLGSKLEIQESSYMHFKGLKMSLDGSSLHRYELPCDQIIKRCRKEGSEIMSRLDIELIIQVPKKYMYYCMGLHQGLDESMIQCILELL